MHRGYELIIGTSPEHAYREWDFKSAGVLRLPQRVVEPVPELRFKVATSRLFSSDRDQVPRGPSKCTKGAQQKFGEAPRDVEADQQQVVRDADALRLQSKLPVKF